MHERGGKEGGESREGEKEFRGVVMKRLDNTPGYVVIVSTAGGITTAIMRISRVRQYN